MVTKFQPYDMNNSEVELHEHAGQVPVSVEPLDPREYDEAEGGPMFKIRFEDGFETYAFADELSEEDE